MKNYNVFNYHLTNACNYHCAYCFGKFENQKHLNAGDAKRVIDNIHAYFEANGVKDGRINFAGGEPLLYPHLDELIDYTHSLGMLASIVTNGSLLTVERVRGWKGKVSQIGISIDSPNEETNCLIGRCCNEKVKDLAYWEELAKVIHECGITLKVNTVVSAANLSEDFTRLYNVLRPDKVKMFQVHMVKGINDSAESYAITRADYTAFVARHKVAGLTIVEESEKSMENSYLMVNPEGHFQLNDDGSYNTYGDCKTESLTDILPKVPMDNERFGARYA